MLEDTDFEFPIIESKLDRVRVAWDNFSNDKEKDDIVNNWKKLLNLLKQNQKVKIRIQKNLTRKEKIQWVI